MTRERVVMAGLGDSGVPTAIRLARRAEVIGISAKPALVSGQELGWRLSSPHDWARANWIPFDRFRGLDRVRTVHGTLTGLDLAARRVLVRHDDGSTSAEAYDALVISTGVSNGFWRLPDFQSADEIGVALRAAHDRLAAGGAARRPGLRPCDSGTTGSRSPGRIRGRRRRGDGSASDLRPQ